jgi:hypothetical protein
MSGPVLDLAPVCEELVWLRRLAAEHGASANLETIVLDAVDGADVSGPLTELCRRLGVPVESLRGAELPGVRPGPPTGDVYVCPRNLCTRTWVREPGRAIPVCNIARLPLSYDRREW